jgi:hypothetical protein
MTLYIAVMKMPAILFLSLLSMMAHGQRTIKGRVINAVDSAAVPGSSVFITNTSKGTTSDNNGYFELNDVPVGKHELIISSIGYETNVFSFSDEQLPMKLKVIMQIKVRELENVTVEPSVEEGWDKWGKMFTDNFIGTTDNSERCLVKNKEKIKFRYYKKSNRVIAYADEPILIENKALGYTIHYQLENFEVNFKDKTTFFLGYSLFDDQTKDGKEPKSKWERRRREAYEGSVLHFMQCLYHNRVMEEGFEVRRMVKIPNTEKARVKNMYMNSRIIHSDSRGGLSVEIKGHQGNKISNDSSAYYERILRENDFIDIYGRDLLGADSLIVKTEDNYKFLYFPAYLYVVYKKELEEESYLRNSFDKRKPGFQRSYVSLINDNAIYIDKAGNYFNPQDFFTSGYWGWSEKISNLLPLDYEP